METTVSVAEARRIVGASANSLNDDQVREILHTLQLLAREQLLYNGSKVSGNGNELKQPHSPK